jgi:hypothetical protein
VETGRATTGWTFWGVVKYALIAFGVLVALFLAALAYLWWWMSGGIFTQERFEPKVWSRPITNAEDSTCYRGGMAADIRDRVLRPGMSRAEVKRLLGEPDKDFKQDEYWYVLGMCSGLRIDYDVLHVYFDANGALQRAQIRQH